MAFNKEARQIIRARAQETSEVSGISDRPLEASHITHSRQYEGYMWPINGILMTDMEHLLYHEEFANLPIAIGLTKANNVDAIDGLRHRVQEFNREHGIEPISYETREHLQGALIEVVSRICSMTDQQNPYQLRDEIQRQRKASKQQKRRRSRFQIEESW